MVKFSNSSTNPKFALLKQRLKKNTMNRELGLRKQQPIAKVKGNRVQAGSQYKDARQKLMQKKRQKVADARDILVRLAQKGDAREKLNKIRHQTTSVAAVASISNVREIGANIISKTDRNGKITLVTKSKVTTKSNATNSPKLKTSALPAHTKRMRKATAAAVATLQRPPQYLRRIEPTNPYINLHKWNKPSGINIATSPLYFSTPLNAGVTHIPTIALDDEEMPLVSNVVNARYQQAHHVQPTIHHHIPYQQVTPYSRRSASNILSRLDTTPNLSVPSLPETHGIFGQHGGAITKVVPNQRQSSSNQGSVNGHRIIVSNLQPTVTQEDVKELFEDIGELVSTRLGRNGVAEVVYKQLKDAQTAVDTYHNRQLDGEPMKCVLVNKVAPLTSAQGARISQLAKQQQRFPTIDLVTSDNGNEARDNGRSFGLHLQDNRKELKNFVIPVVNTNAVQTSKPGSQHKAHTGSNPGRLSPDVNVIHTAFGRQYGRMPLSQRMQTTTNTRQFVEM